MANPFIELALMSADDTVELYQDLCVEIEAILSLLIKMAGMNLDFSEVQRKIDRAQREMTRGEAYRADLTKIRDSLHGLTTNERARLDQARRLVAQEYSETQVAWDRLQQSVQIYQHIPQQVG